MHILFIPSWYPATPEDFSGSFFFEQAQALSDAGHQVGVASVRGIPVYSPAQLRTGRRGIRRSVEHGVVTYRADAILPFPKIPGANQRVLLSRWRNLVMRYIAENGRPDLLHAHAMFPAGLVAKALGEEFGLPFLVTEHRPSSIEGLKHKWLGSKGREAAKAASSLVAVARGFVPVLEAAYQLDEKKWRYIPGLLSPQFESVAPREAPALPFTFLHVSHLDPGKRVDLLIEAFAKEFENDYSVRLRIAGGSVHRLELEKLAEQLGVASQVDFIGPVQRKDIAAVFSAAHVFVLTSEAEAFGTVLWEAMATGLPLISTDTWAGMNAVVPANGLLAAVDDVVEIGSVMTRIQAEFGKYDPAAIREICIRHCGASAFVAEYQELYMKAVATGRQ